MGRKICVEEMCISSLNKRVVTVCDNMFFMASPCVFDLHFHIYGFIDKDCYLHQS